MTPTQNGVADKSARAATPYGAEPVPVSGIAGIANADDPVVGHKTWADGSHTPLLKSEADALWVQVEAAKARRESLMPTLDDCLRMLGDVSQRLRELGWSEAIYCPKDGTVFDAIEFGSTGIHACHYEGEWPKGSWWVEDGGDLWPSRPVMYRKRPAQGTSGFAQDPQGLDPKGAGPTPSGVAP